MWPTPLSGPVEMPAPPGQAPELQPGPPMVPDASFRRLPELGGAALGLGGRVPRVIPHEKDGVPVWACEVFTCASEAGGCLLSPRGAWRGGLGQKRRGGRTSSSWLASPREKRRGGRHLPGRGGQWLATRSLQRPARVTQTGTGPGKGPSVCPGLLPQHREPRNKGAILSRM